MIEARLTNNFLLLLFNFYNIAHYWAKQVYRRSKAAARQSPTALKTKKNKIWRKTIFNYGGWNSYTLQSDTIMTLISPGDCTLQCGMWLWNHDSEFTKCQHPAMWYVALGWHAVEFARWQVVLGWHAMEFAQTFAILEFYIWFWFWPYHRSRHVILHLSAKFYPNRTTLGRKQWRHVDFQDGGSRPSWTLWVQ